MSEEEKEKEKESEEVDEVEEGNTQDTEKDSKGNKDEKDNTTNKENEKDGDKKGEKMANEEKKEKHKHEEHESEKHSRIKEKLHIMKHHVSRNGWRCASIALIVLILVFSALLLFGVFSIKYNGFSKGTVETKKLTMIVLNDKRCGTDCDTIVSQLVPQLKSIFPEATVTEIDYSTKEGKALFESTKVQYLPAFLFNNAVNSSANFSKVQPYLVSAGSYQSLRIGAAFDPTKEICSNKIDDNGDGKIDCLDPECTESFECREEKKANLMLFIMSDCPYGKKAIEALKEVYTTFNKSFTYEVHYIANEQNTTGFASLHGQYEVDEDIVQLCVKKYSPDKWLDYTYCRSIEGIKGNDWHNCANQTKVDITKVEACAKGDEGKALLREDIKIANAMGIGASPTWIANNRYQFGGIDAATVQTQLCKYNSQLSGCGAAVSNTSSVPAGSCG